MAGSRPESRSFNPSRAAESQLTDIGHWGEEIIAATKTKLLL